MDDSTKPRKPRVAAINATIADICARLNMIQRHHGVGHHAIRYIPSFEALTPVSLRGFNSLPSCFAQLRRPALIMGLRSGRSLYHQSDVVNIGREAMSRISVPLRVPAIVQLVLSCICVTVSPGAENTAVSLPVAANR